MPHRLVFAVLLPGLLGCECVTLNSALFACGEGGDCPAGTRCAQPGEVSAGFCVPLDGGSGGSDGGLPPGVRAVDLVFDNADGGALDAFPLLVALDPAVIDYSAIADPRTELKFYDPDTNQALPFQIESWSPGGESVLWVLVPNIAARRSDDRITLYWGPGAGGQEDATGYSVFGAYTAVWHLEPGATKPSSASAQHAGTLTGGAAGPGQIGSALRLSGSGDQRVLIDSGATLFDGWNAFTLELWLRPEYASYAAINAEGGVLDKGGSLNLGRVFKTATPALIFQLDMHFNASPYDTYLNTALPLRQWTWLAWSFDGKALTLYADGEQDDRTGFAASTSMRSGTNPFFLGDNSNPIDGAIDEVRISRTGHSPDWMRAQYRSMTRRLFSFVPR